MVSWSHYTGSQLPNLAHFQMKQKTPDLFKPLICVSITGNQMQFLIHPGADTSQAAPRLYYLTGD